MGSDAIVNTRVSAINNKSFNKNRRSKFAKLKPNEVDCRTEHGFSQVNRKALDGKKHKAGRECPPSTPNGRRGNRPQGGNQATSVGKCEHETILPITYNNEAVSGNKPFVRRSDRNGLSKGLYGNRVASYSGSCSTSCSEDDGCLDDWEAVADALNAENNRQNSDLEHYASKPEVSTANCRHQGSNRAWSPDDVYRPRNLPSITKQQHNQFQSESERCSSRGRAVFSWQTAVPRQQQQRQLKQQQQWQQQKQQLPSACPICCEDFDVTDSSFEPCPCGFRLCLFCHKKILEVDGRCPGCRKQYDSVSADVASPNQTTGCTKNLWI